MTDISNEKLEILQAYEKNGYEIHKGNFLIEMSEVDDIIHTWVCQMRTKRRHIISGSLIE